MSKLKLTSEKIKFIVKTFLDAAHNKKFHGKWMTPDTWAKLIDRYYKPPADNSFDGDALVYSIGRTKWLVNAIETTNYIDETLKLFRNNHRRKNCPVIWGFYACSPDVKPEGNAAGNNWHLDIYDGKELLEEKVTRSKTLKFSFSAKELEDEEKEHTRKKMKPQNQEKGAPGLTESNTTPLADIHVASIPPVSSSAITSVPLSSTSTSYWQSSEAKKLFHPKGNEVSALDAVNNQIELLLKASDSPNGIFDVIDSGGRTTEEIIEEISDYQRWVLQQKICFITLALTVAKNKMEVVKNWDMCCEEALQQGNMIGLRSTKNSRTIRNWYQDFRKERKVKVNLLPGKHNLPPFLQQNQDITIALKEFGREHLHELSVELFLVHIHNVILPKLVKETTNADPTDEKYKSDVLELLGRYGLSSVSVSTACRWMKCLGFKFQVRKKCYYVDGHEKPATVEYRKQFIQRYLTYEWLAHRWIQLTKQESIECENKGLVPRNSGYHYSSDTGIDMVEYHVDSCSEFQVRMNEETEFGGQLSVRKEEHERPLLMFGHDEAIFKQFLLTKKSWCGPNGETVLVPKDDGQGLMISAFQSREFGFGYHLDEEQLAKVNFGRRGEKYLDEEAAKKYKGNSLKGDLKESPFVFVFEYGASNEGYWCYERMILQLED